MVVTEFTVTGMTCGNCERHVTEEVAEVAGVTTATADHTTGLLCVTTEPTASAGSLHADSAQFTDAVLTAVAEAGYAAVRV